jgi:membrane associated rhomboid family serine protease
MTTRKMGHVEGCFFGVLAIFVVRRRKREDPAMTIQ